MKNILKSCLILSVLAALATPSALQAQGKIASIDLRKVFDNYYKTKQADALLKEEATGLETERKSMIENWKKLDTDYKALIDKANDQAISADERSKSKQSADKKIAELKETEQAVTEFERAARAKLAEKQRQKRDAIVKEIRGVIEAKAKNAGLSMVIDVAAESANSTPVVLFNNGENDLTEAILSQLNAAAPTPTKEEPKEEPKTVKPADKKTTK